MAQASPGGVEMRKILRVRLVVIVRFVHRYKRHNSKPAGCASPDRCRATLCCPQHLRTGSVDGQRLAFTGVPPCAGFHRCRRQARLLRIWTGVASGSNTVIIFCWYCPVTSVVL